MSTGSGAAISGSTTQHLERCLKRLGQHDEQARTELLGFANRRLKVLADRMFYRCPRLHSVVQSDDLFQDASIRLWQSLEKTYPTTVNGFMGLAAVQIRRSLLDLIRKYLTHPIVQVPDSDLDMGTDEGESPDELAVWSDFHNAAGQLPEAHRTAFDLLFYHDLPQFEAAELMNVSIRTIQRYWSDAQLEIREKLDGAYPEL